ncbi:unnamed protein product [Rhizophagus irregularis]|nr:unnamed protein product [Rhizophagus irregularis]
MAETKELTPTGKIKRPSYETVAHLVKDSWDAVDVNLIRRSFKCCGISNKRDGTEDDWIFNNDRLKQANQLNDEVEVLSDKENDGDEEYGNEEENVEEAEYEEEEEEEEERRNMGKGRKRNMRRRMKKRTSVMKRTKRMNVKREE